MGEDHLSNEVSIAAELTPTGVAARARSRFLSSVDRLLGNVVDLPNPHLERVAQKQRAKTSAELRKIEAMADLEVRRLHADPVLAARALEQQARISVRRHENKTAVVAAAIEDLRTTPPSDEQNERGGDTVNESFLNRIERYAEDASEDQVRERWGRVLAAEIRAPGTFSPKVLRIVDELDPSTAALFERFCQNRIGDAVPTCLSGSLPFAEQARLVSAGLLVEPGLGQAQHFGPAATKDGRDLLFMSLGGFGLAFAANSEIPKPSNPKDDSAPYILGSDTGHPAVTIFVLTDEGHALSSILEDKTESAFDELAARMASSLTNVNLLLYRKQKEDWIQVGNIPAKSHG